jgi:5'-methylthioadenosine phosphorylase
VPEAQLAREAEICYACMAHVTDYDVWHESEETVTVEAVIKNLLTNADVAKQSIQELVPALPDERTCDCQHALRDAIITDRDAIPEQVKQDLSIIVGKYLQ